MFLNELGRTRSQIMPSYGHPQNFGIRTPPLCPALDFLATSDENIFYWYLQVFCVVFESKSAEIIEFNSAGFESVGAETQRFHTVS